MSETLFRFMLKEIESFRIICKCGTTVEISLDRLNGMSQNLIKCQVCENVIQNAGSQNLINLAKDIIAIRNMNHFSVGISLPLPPATK